MGGVLLTTSGLPTQATAADRGEAAKTPDATEADATPVDPWRSVLDDADLVWRRMPTTWHEGPFLGNGFLGSGIYAEPGAASTAVRFNVQHSEAQDHRPEFGSLFGLARSTYGTGGATPSGTPPPTTARSKSPCARASRR
ncbi:hypothetical protein [Streptomyces adelaidensis]|uniref:hypothetical protein n=1 Tax=Streptomyces adelaidensis TaxID=2796465 RepID=UPI0035567631